MGCGSKEFLLALLEQHPAYTSVIELKMGMSLLETTTNPRFFSLCLFFGLYYVHSQGNLV